MRSATALLTLLALAASILAAPMPQHLVIRVVPNVPEVIRNPAPIDANANIDAGLSLGLIKIPLKADLNTRAVPAIEKIPETIGPVTGRAAPAVDKSIEDPTTIV